MKNSIVTILSLRQAEKQVGCIQHQSAVENKHLIRTQIYYENCRGNVPRTKDIVSAMGKSQPIVCKYLNELAADGVIDFTIGDNATRTGPDKRAKGWFIPGVI